MDVEPVNGQRRTAGAGAPEGEPRSLTLDEHRYLVRLLERVGDDDRVRGLTSAKVGPLSDGGMGSLRFASMRPSRRRASRVVTDEFIDTDGVPVSVELTADQFGDLYELDSFKADFTAVRSWPTLRM
ncbi:DUF6984 family protein [Agromyces sp. NPDC058064]|uniref:DUF6984 family protein n=1 Tax=Agromyces sp. NPDC058064 TaxID=3346322 RepID=UPI0036DCA288